jgi:hypothetical protein
MNIITLSDSKPIFVTNRSFATLKDAEAAYNELVRSINFVLQKNIDVNNNRLETGVNSINRLTYDFMTMGG